jgi:hypothetical protein
MVTMMVHLTDTAQKEYSTVCRVDLDSCQGGVLPEEFGLEISMLIRGSA